MHKLLRFIVILGFICFGLLCSSTIVNAFGVSPSPLIRDNVANGVKIPVSVTLLRADMNFASEINVVQGSGEGFRYLSLPKTSFIFPAGQQRMDYEFFIAPETAPNGKYEAIMIFEKRSLPGAGASISGSGASIQEAVGVRVVFTVTDDEVKELNILNFEFEKAELGMPLVFYLFMRNSGNVDVRPDRITLSMVDKTDPAVKYERVYLANEIDILDPGKENNVRFVFTDKIPQGEYIAKVAVYLGDKELYRKEDIDVKIHPPGTLGQNAEFVSFFTDKQEYVRNELVEFNSILNNTGEVGLPVVFFTEILKDGQRIDLLRSGEKYVLKQQQGKFRNEYRFIDHGTYEAKGYFEYGANQTEKKTLNINISKPPVRAGTIVIYAGIVVVLAGIILAVTLIIFRRRKSHKVHKQRHHSHK